MPTAATHRLVRILWRDAQSTDEWQNHDDAVSSELANIRSVGWLIDEDVTRIVLASHLSDGVAAATWSIPVQAIVKRTTIREPKE